MLKRDVVITLYNLIHILIIGADITHLASSFVDSDGAASNDRTDQQQIAVLLEKHGFRMGNWLPSRSSVMSTLCRP